MDIDRNTPAFAEHIILNALCREGKPVEVLKQFLKCGYNSNALSSRFFSYEKKTRGLVPMSPLPNPFVTACENANVPVVKLLLLLGMRKEAKIMEHHKSPMEVFKDNSELRPALEDNTPWLDRRFPQEYADVMKGQLEAHIMKQGFMAMFIYGLQGLKITDVSLVFTRQFQDYSALVQAFVYRMLMSTRQRKGIADRIAKVSGRQGVPSVLQRALESDSVENVQKRKKCLDSVGLLPMELLLTMIETLLPAEERISLVREIMNNHDLFQTDKVLWTLKEELTYRLFKSICM